MKNIFKYLILCLVVLTTSSFVYAVDNTPPNTKAQRYFCLKSDPAGGHGATITLDSTKPQPFTGIEMYVMVRIDNKLTTGNPTLDADPKVFGTTQNYDALRTSLGFDNNGKPEAKPAGGYKTFQGAGVQSPGKNPVQDASTLNVKWHDDLTPGEGRDHFWFGMQLVDPAPAVDNGTSGGQQQGTFEWAVNASNSDCGSIKWDPLGYVFDAKTLGVIPGASVTIIDAKTGKPIEQGVGANQVAINPYLTVSNGSFSFFTQPGEYKLLIGGNYNNLPLVIENPSLVVGYEDKGFVQLYTPDSTIKELAGQTVRTDIAVKTVGATPSLATPKLVDVNTDGNGSEITVSGMVTPFSPKVKVVPVYVDPTTNQSQDGLIAVQIDKTSGRFKFTADQVLNETYIFARIDLRDTTPIVQNKDLYNRLKTYLTFKISSFITVNAAASNSVVINPIPSYLEGIAQDLTGVVIPSATIGIYLQGSNVPAYQTKSDVKGHYVIGSQFIPSFPYEIRLTKITGEVINMSTTEYLRQNAVYHKSNNISSFSIVKTSTSFDNTNTLVVTKTVIPQKNSKGTASNNGETNSRDLTNSATPTVVQQQGLLGTGAPAQTIIIIVIALLMLIMIGAGAFIVMRAKQPPAPPQL